MGSNRRRSGSAGVDWMRKLHPDHTGEKGTEDRRVKEINEAYEVLKYYSSRAPYDLRRVYERRKKVVSLRRAVFRKSYLLLLPVLLGLIYLSLHESEAPSTAKLNRKVCNGFDEETGNSVLLTERICASKDGGLFGTRPCSWGQVRQAPRRRRSGP